MEGSMNRELLEVANALERFLDKHRGAVTQTDWETLSKALTLLREEKPESTMNDPEINDAGWLRAFANIGKFSEQIAEVYRLELYAIADRIERKGSPVDDYQELIGQPFKIKKGWWFRTRAFGIQFYEKAKIDKPELSSEKYKRITGEEAFEIVFALNTMKRKQRATPDYTRWLDSDKPDEWNAKLEKE
jgi:hypothetical protein